MNPSTQTLNSFTDLSMKCFKSSPWCISIFLLALKGLSGRQAEEDGVLFVLELTLFLDELERDSSCCELFSFINTFLVSYASTPNSGLG